MPRIKKDKQKKFFVDIETSGLKPYQGAVILQIGCLTDDPDDGTFSETILPTNEEYGRRSPKAIEVNGLTWEVLQEKGRLFAEVKEDFIRYLLTAEVENGVFVGQNPGFDMGFLKFYMQADLDYVGAPYERPVDVRNMFSEAIRRGRIITSENGRAGHIISEVLGVDPEPEVHDALEGALVVRRHYDKLKELLAADAPKLG